MFKKRIEKDRKRFKRKVHIRKRIYGTAERPRMTVFRSNKNISVQVIDDDARVTVASVSTLEKDFKPLKANIESGAKIGEEGADVTQTGQHQAGASDSAGASGGKSDKVNLNTATEAELQTISGIGQKRASDIIAYRESTGRFKSVDDLKKVSGIGDKTLEKLKEYVTVD